MGQARGGREREGGGRCAGRAGCHTGSWLVHTKFCDGPWPWTHTHTYTRVFTFTHTLILTHTPIHLLTHSIIMHSCIHWALKKDSERCAKSFYSNNKSARILSCVEALCVCVCERIRLVSIFMIILDRRRWRCPSWMMALPNEFASWHAPPPWLAQFLFSALSAACAGAKLVCPAQAQGGRGM